MLKQRHVKEIVLVPCGICGENAEGYFELVGHSDLISQDLKISKLYLCANCMMKLEDDIEYDAQKTIENYGLADYHLPLYDANKARRLEDVTQVKSETTNDV